MNTTTRRPKLSTGIVLVKRLILTAHDFDATELEQLAQSCLEIGGFIQPPVVRRKGYNYEIVSGHKQVAAAKRASEIDPRGCETIPVMILDDEIEKAALKQLDLLLDEAAPAPEPTPEPAPATTTYLAEQNECVGRLMHLQFKNIKSAEKVSVSATQVEAIKACGRNWIPVIVKEIGDYRYEVVANHDVFEATKKAGLDRVWLIIINPTPENLAQVQPAKPVPQPELTLPKPQLEIVKPAVQLPKKSETVAELKKRCKSLGLKGYSKFKKQELLALLAKQSTPQAA